MGLHVGIAGMGRECTAVQSVVWTRAASPLAINACTRPE